MHHLIDTLARERRDADRRAAAEDRRARAARLAGERARLTRWMRSWP